MKFEPDKIDRLFDDQIARWPLLACGIESLKQAQTRDVDVDGHRVQIRHLPHRMVSTTAAVDRASIEKRPCFLCAANLPPEEKGIAFNSEFTVYCNPFPILDRHLTIVHNEHRPQRIAGQVGNMLALAEALPEFFIIYNGPECGASAPDHMHFQACLKAGVPVVTSIPKYGVRVLDLDEAIRHLNEVAPREPEPLLNLAVFREEDETVAVLFPRRKHRPSVFHTGEFTVSPATIDLCGIFVTPLEKDFQRISGEDIRKMFDEVTLQI